MGFGAANGLQAFIVSTRTTSTRTVNSNKGMPTGPFKRDVKYTKQTTAAVGLLVSEIQIIVSPQKKDVLSLRNSSRRLDNRPNVSP